jgi:pyruvate,water dikinase
MTYTVLLEEPGSADVDRVGGKGRNLVLLRRSGFRVPPGYVLVTDAYRELVRHNRLAGPIAELVSAMNCADLEDVEDKTAQIRKLIDGAELPASIERAILDAYAGLGNRPFVAVRSSGTAEDLAEASFAGQHDTVLDVRGEAELLTAVRRCWASLWSARATAYRQRNGFDHEAVALAVVVQVMVSARVSGVLFTANPMTEATGEIVVNASWGLGEGIVSGILTPDQFLLCRDTLRVKSQRLGSKEVEVVRSPSGAGAIVRQVTADRSSAACLSDAELVALGRLGRDVARYYDDVPQDIEWAISGEELFVLQSRDITGVEFSWDEEITGWNNLQPALPDDTIWSRKWSDIGWTGKKTPLGFSIRDEMGAHMHMAAERLWGFDDVAEQRLFKYHKGEVYYNCRIDYLNQRYLLSPALRRSELMPVAPESWFTDLAREPFSWSKVVKAFARVRLLDPGLDPFNCWRNIYRQMETEEGKAAGAGLPVEQIQRLSDRELQRYLDSRIMVQKEWVEDLWTPFFLVMPLAMSLLSSMVENWHQGDNPLILGDLITGLPELSITLKENIELWKLTEKIRASQRLTELFQDHPGGEFFTVLDDDPEGRQFLAAYREFLVDFGFRGHSDRDLYHPRRIENPEIDYQNFASLLTADSVSPEATFKGLIERRRAAEDDMIASIRRQPLAGLKIEAFKLVQSWLLKFFLMRDDERHHTDRIQFSKKRAVHEINRRLTERGVLAGDDIYFLTKHEVYDLLDGKPRTRLTAAKIAARRRDFDRLYDEFEPPLYIRGNVPVDLDGAAPEGVEGIFTGVGTSRGFVTGVARIVPSQQDIGRVRKGDIMVATATDPGWTSVFLVISGLVLETGGMLAHGSCISREYGIPAVQLGGARKLIKDGSTISVNGDTGEVRILGEPDEGTTSREVTATVVLEPGR